MKLSYRLLIKFLGKHAIFLLNPYTSLNHEIFCRFSSRHVEKDWIYDSWKRDILREANPRERGVTTSRERNDAAGAEASGGLRRKRRRKAITPRRFASYVSVRNKQRVRVALSWNVALSSAARWNALDNVLERGNALAIRRRTEKSTI